MSKIRIKNFGPIKDGLCENDGWIDIKKVTVFIGNQGSGKSTVAKLISTFAWIEKALVRGDYEISDLQEKDVFRKYCSYHKMSSYFHYRETNPDQVLLHDTTEIDYHGEAYSIRYKDRHLKIDEIPQKKYSLPQIMYVPADRNFVSTVDDLKSLRLFSEPLFEFLEEYRRAKKDIAGEVKLPINNTLLEYDDQKDVMYIKNDKYKIPLTDASSGFQSLVPLFIVTNFLAQSVKGISEIGNHGVVMSSEEMERFKASISEIYSNDTLTDDQRRAAITVLSSKFNKSAFLNIVEEPEQNLFPESQHQVLSVLLQSNNQAESNKLILTTHSPYLINYLTLAVKAEDVYALLREKKYKLDEPEYGYTNEIVSISSTVKADDLVIYELNQKDGTIKKLGNFEGIPSDRNYLNQSLAETNRLFDSLLEIEEEL